MGSLLCEEFGPEADDDDKNDDHRSFKLSDERVMNERGFRGWLEEEDLTFGTRLR